MSQKKVFFAWCVLALATIGTAAAQQNSLRALLPADIASLSAMELNDRGLAAHNQKDYAGSAELFYYETVVAPDAARGWFNLACALALLGQVHTAALELQKAVEVDRAWTLPNLADHDLDPLRTGTVYKQLLDWIAGKATAPEVDEANPAAYAPSLAAQTVPGEYRAMSPDAIDDLAYAAHEKADYETSTRLFGYLVQLRPGSAVGHFNFACALSRLGRAQESVAELHSALSLGGDTEKDLGDPDLANARSDPAYSAMLAAFVGRGGAGLGAWQGPGNDQPAKTLPEWLPQRETVWPSASLSLNGRGEFGIGASAAYEVGGYGELRGTLLFWWGFSSLEGPNDGPGDDGTAPPPAPRKSGILDVRLVTPSVLDVEYVGGERLPGVIGYFVSQ